MKDLLPLSFAGENRWLWLNGVQLQMAALYGPKRTMSKNQCATQTLLRQNWKSNKKSVFNACPDQYSDLVNGRPLFPWWNRLSVVTKAVCPHVWLLNALSEVACKECALVKWTGKKREQRRKVHCVINNQLLGHLHFCLLYLSLMCWWNGAWMCDRCHIFTPDHFSILAHTTALIRRALHVLHVSCRLEKEKRKNLQIRMDVENWIFF